MTGRFADWVATADAVRATTKKLEKNRLLGAYLASLDDVDVATAARLFAGAPFPRKDERVLSVGWSAAAVLVIVLLVLIAIGLMKFNGPASAARAD